MKTTGLTSTLFAALFAGLFAALLAGPAALGQGTCATAVLPSPATLGSVELRGAGAPGGAVEAWYRVELQPGEALFMGAATLAGQGPEPDGDTVIEVRDDACGAVIRTLDPSAYQPVRNLSTQPISLRVGVRDVSGRDTRTLVLVDIHVDLDPCGRIGPDVFEPNDTLATGAPLGAGSYDSLTVAYFEPDHFLFDVAAGERLTVALRPAYDGPVWPRMRLELLEAQSGGVLTSVASAGAGTTRVASWLNGGSATRVAARVTTQWSHACGVYGLDVALTPSACSAVLEDALEGGDACGTGFVLGAGTYRDLVVYSADPDAFTLDVPLLSPTSTAVKVRVSGGGASLSGSVRQSCSDQGIPLQLQPDGSLATVLQLPAFAAERPEVLLGFSSSIPVPSCATYDLEVSWLPQALGAEFCAQPMLGYATELHLWGSAEVARDELFFTVSGGSAAALPLIVFIGSERGASLWPVFGGPTAPFTLCLGGQIHRIQRHTQFSGAQISRRLDLAGAAAVALQPGTTWVFQAYLRGYDWRALTNAVALELR
ncbi:MAG: hypothetical protein R3F49_10070 [Planctomycetota bacterium]